MHIVIDNRIRRSSTGRYSDRLVEHLQSVDTTNQYTILLQPDDPWKPVAKNFTTLPCSFGQFSFNPLDQIGFARLLYSLKADLVHFPMNQQPLFYLKPVITTTMDLTMLRFTRPGKTPYPVFLLKMAGYRFLFWYSNKKSKAIITISNFVKKDLAQHYPFTKGKTTTTYCASEPPIKKVTKPKVQPKNFITYVGTPFPHKNLENLIKAYGILHKDQSELELVLIGKKEHYYTELEKQYGNTPGLHFTGFVSDEELRWYYENARGYIFPSLSEGFGLPGLEAMVHSCPVVSSNATCLPEIYGDAAHYFNPTDINDMASKINDVLSNKKLRDSLIKKGHAQVKKYSWQKMAEQTLAVYKKALGQK